MREILHATLLSVVTELERLEPASIIAARARGVLDGTSGTRSVVRKVREPNDRDREIVVSYQGGNSGLQVAAAFGITQAAVYAALRRCGVEPRHPGPSSGAKPLKPEAVARVERIRAMRAGGSTLEEIGSAEHVTRERIRQICMRAGIDTSERAVTEEEKRGVAEYLSGASLEVSAALIGVSPHKLRGLLLRSGHKPRPSPKSSKRLPQTLANAERAAQLYASGHGIQQIADEIGYPSGAMIYRLLAIAGVKPSRVKRHHVAPVEQAA